MQKIEPAVELDHLDVAVPQNLPVDAQLAKFVLDDADPMPFKLFKQLEQDGCLARPQKAGQHIQFCFALHNCLLLFGAGTQRWGLPGSGEQAVQQPFAACIPSGRSE